MDRPEAMGLSGPTSYYMHRGVAGSESGLQFQSNIGSTLLVEPTSTIPSHGVNVGALAGVGSIEPVRRKRGRPRKYGSDGSVSLALSPSSSTPPVKLATTQKRGRGRPPGTGQKQQLASFGGWLSGTAGTGFTPHVITIGVGEDITTKIMSFSQQGPRAICILSANGAVSTVTLRQPSTSGGTVTYEGRFEILCLSGSYVLTDNGGACGRSGGLSVSLASPDGCVIGGGVGGMLIAATPVQVIVGSFLCGNSKAKNRAGESQESASGLDHQTVDNAATQSAIQPTHNNLTPTSSMNVWPGSRSVDMQNAHVDIDLMRRL
ncbi:hypothetical protein LguiB_023655 [Lonicera macranthoides]